MSLFWLALLSVVFLVPFLALYLVLWHASREVNRVLKDGAPYFVGVTSPQLLPRTPAPALNRTVRLSDGTVVEFDDEFSASLLAEGQAPAQRDRARTITRPVLSAGRCILCRKLRGFLRSKGEHL